MEAGEAPDEYFELELTEACKVYKNVELLASKTYTDPFCSSEMTTSHSLKPAHSPASSLPSAFAELGEE